MSAEPSHLALFLMGICIVAFFIYLLWQISRL